MTLEKIQWLDEQLTALGYIAEPDLVSSLYLMETLGKPMLVEGEAGVGKTEIAKSLAQIYQCPLIRLQCYEGLDAHHALYDWDYQRQLLAIQMAGDSSPELIKQQIYSESYLLKRPLLSAISASTPVVLLIDEIDRADEEFEAFLLEILSDFQISIPELGTFKAASQPRVVLTSNAVRELSDALRRRCLYHYVDYPDADKELRIVNARMPGINQQLASDVVRLVQQLRVENLRKTPGIAETLDWAAALDALGIVTLADANADINTTLAALLKTREDHELVHSLTSLPFAIDAVRAEKTEH